MIEGDIGGNPMNGQRWVRRSTRHLSEALKKRGHAVSPQTVGRLLKAENFSLKANGKRVAGTRHADRDRQFRYIAKLKQAALAAGVPVISVDSKKKEMIGNFKNPGQTWSRQAEAVNDHDFRHDASYLAVPRGLYVINHNRGYVEVGISADTAEFAVEAIARWWQSQGRQGFRKADSLLILCDGGGSNGCRSRLWKLKLQEGLADRFGLELTVCHYPSGASKYNPVEHRLFSFISINWAGKPLRSLPLMLSYIRGTKTETGLRVNARLIRKRYKTKKKVSNQAFKAICLKRHRICPQWNYTIRPRAT